MVFRTKPAFVCDARRHPSIHPSIHPSLETLTNGKKSRSRFYDGIVVCLSSYIISKLPSSRIKCCFRFRSERRGCDDVRRQKEARLAPIRFSVPRVQRARGREIRRTTRRYVLRLLFSSSSSSQGGCLSSARASRAGRIRGVRWNRFRLLVTDRDGCV